MKHILIIASTLIILTVSNGFQGPDNGGPDNGGPLRKINGFYARMQQFPGAEKVILSTNKPFYTIPGEIWYRVDIPGHAAKTDKSSKICRVEFINSSGEVLVRQKLNIESGTASNMITLPESIQEGVYWINAGTQWMNNFPEMQPDPVQINVYDPGKKHDLRKANISKITIDFFPEGGSLLWDVPSTIAYRIRCPGEQFPAERLLIRDKNGRTVRDLMISGTVPGRFRFTPEKDHQYSAELWMNDSTRLVYPFPEAGAYGTSVHLVKASPETLQIAIHDKPGKQDALRYLLVRSRSAIHHQISYRSKNDPALMNISARGIPPGISELAVLDSSGKVLCSRLFFKHPQSFMNIRVNGLREKYRPGESTTLEISATGPRGNPVEADLAVSVISKDLMETSAGMAGDLLSKTWVYSEISWTGPHVKGLLKKENKELLDNILMVSGWNHFSLPEMTKRVRPTLDYPVETGMNISGKVVMPLTGSGLAHQMVILAIPGEHSFISGQFANESGRFTFSGFKDFYGSKNMILQLTQRENIGEAIFTADDSILTYKSYFYDHNRDKIFNRELKEAMETSRNNSELTDVRIRMNSRSQPVILVDDRIKRSTFDFSPGKLPMTKDIKDFLDRERLRRSTLDAFGTEDLFAGKKDTSSANPSGMIEFTFDNTDISIQPDRYIRMESMEEILRELVQVVKVRKRKGQYSFKIPTKREFYDGYPLVLVDGIPSFDPHVALNLDPEIVDRVDVIYTDEFLKDLPVICQNGVLAIFTKGKKFTLPESEDRLEFTFRGYEPDVEYQIPDIYTGEHGHDQIPDLRQEVYWNPQVRTGMDGKASIRFVNTDDPTAYRIFIYGFSREGIPVECLLQYEVGLD